MLLQGANAGLSPTASTVQSVQNGEFPKDSHRADQETASTTAAQAARKGSSLRVEADDTSLFYRDPREALGAGLKLDPAARGPVSGSATSLPANAVSAASSGVSETVYLGRLSGLVQGR